jgi:hypothetical protein
MNATTIAARATSGQSQRNAAKKRQVVEFVLPSQLAEALAAAFLCLSIRLIVSISTTVILAAKS